ncbi:unnamed protein product [Cyclocybe aegerita]|uniref:Pyridoxamine 5'-phosphate oxidase N-terminal domain-containing protein n=1 Tax=Cyclocybe aegerita TaxID=1973307 RepID=A0A8S0WPX4_CYCAE|nr:unnamed protein product [Cyclocybe aegerita]
MGKFYDEIPDFLIKWIKQQKMFWVATAPLSPTGHVNVSPKGYGHTFHVIDQHRVWYEDLTGSGVETISHLRENGRITILFSAFEGPPRIVRLFGTGTVHEFGTPEYNELIPREKRSVGSRSVIVVDVHKVGTSCGFSIPFYAYKSDRMLLNKIAAQKELVDVKVESAALASCDDEPDSEKLPLSDDGLKDYWKNHNAKSIDGLPGLLGSFLSRNIFNEAAASKDWGKDDVTVSTKMKMKAKAKASIWGAGGVAQVVDLKVFAGFVLGVVTTGLWINFAALLRAKVL